MKKKKGKVSKNKKKFFIILVCYVAVFLTTFIVTASTLAWFSSSTWSTNTIYMGGPVYIYFSDTTGVNETSKEGALTVETPKDWDYLYPGMNMRFSSRAVVQGASFTHTKDDGNTKIVYTTGAILRARVYITVTDPDGETTSDIAQDVYRNMWNQIKAKANGADDSRNEGEWVIDDDWNYLTQSKIDSENPDTSDEEDHFFYYVKKNQSYTDSGKYELLEIGGTEDNVSVGFLDRAVITLAGMELNNDHADCQIKITIIFHAFQAFLPYKSEDIGKPYHDTTDTSRSPNVIFSDVGSPMPLTIENSRRYFRAGLSDIYSEIDGAIY